MELTLTPNTFFRLITGVGSVRYTQAEQRESASPNTVNITHPVVENHPLIPIYGHFRDDPNWDSFMASIQEYRRQLNKAED